MVKKIKCVEDLENSSFPSKIKKNKKIFRNVFFIRIFRNVLDLEQFCFCINEVFCNCVHCLKLNLNL